MSFAPIMNQESNWGSLRGTLKPRLKCFVVIIALVMSIFHVDLNRGGMFDLSTGSTDQSPKRVVIAPAPALHPAQIKFNSGKCKIGESLKVTGTGKCTVGVSVESREY